MGFTIFRIKQKRKNYGVPKGGCRNFVSDPCQTAGRRFPSHDPTVLGLDKKTINQYAKRMLAIHILAGTDYVATLASLAQLLPANKKPQPAFENVSILASRREQRMYFKKDRAIYLVTGITDIRKQINGLAQIADEKKADSVLSGDYFVFLGKRPAKP